MIRTIRNGIKFEYVPAYSIVMVMGKYGKYLKHNTDKAGVRITYQDGTRRFISNNWYSNDEIKDL
jgi:hypothetical protein